MEGPLKAAREALTKASSFAERSVVIAEKYIMRLPEVLSVAVRPYSPLCANAIGHIQVDSPLILVFALTIFLVRILAIIFGEDFTIIYFSIWPFADFRFLSPLSWWRLISHILGHEHWPHLQGNLIHLMLVGPACEREYGVYNLIQIMLWTAVTSGIAHMLVGGQGVQLGASGVVFMLILLNSLLEKKDGSFIPLTFVVQVCIWVYKELVAEFFAHDTISHIAHIAGAAVGTIAGYELHGVKVHKRTEPIILSWYRRHKSKPKTT